MRNALSLRSFFGKGLLVFGVLTILLLQPAIANDQSDSANKQKSRPDREKLLLKYGDGQPDGKKSIAGTGE